MIYSLNIPKLLNDYLRPLFNKPKHTAWLNAILYPVIQKHTDFIAFKTQMDTEVTITIQVNRFRQALRDRYGDNTIDIIHPSDYLAEAWVYLSTEPRPNEYDYLISEAHAPVEYDFLLGEYNAQVDYIVRIPSTLSTRYQEINDYVNKYNLTSMTFAIEIV